MPNNNTDTSIRTLIVGAGKAGQLLAENIDKNKLSGVEIVGFIDDDKSKVGKKVGKYSVLGSIIELGSIIKNETVEELIIAIPSSRGVTIRSIIEASYQNKVIYKILPRSAEVLAQKFNEDYLRYLRKILPEDLLGSEVNKSDHPILKAALKNETVLITGAAGSIGSELSRQIVAHGAKRVVLYDWWENGIFNLQNQIKEIHPHANVEYVIGDVKNRRKLTALMERVKPTSVFHAAAYKHVPLMESNASEAILNNIVGTRCVAEVAIKSKVSKFILVSTDKAVNPTNVMGASKRSAEEIINILSSCQATTRFSVVRFGNVINSNGSAIPIFQQQIAKGGPVTVTHKDITRYFMTIPEAVHLILQAWRLGENNDLFVLDMGEPIKIYDLAKLLIALEGYIPDQEISIKITGLRPGEKLYEELLVQQEEVSSTKIDKVFKTQNHNDFNKVEYLYNLDQLLGEIDQDPFNVENIKHRLRKMVSTYSPKE